MKTNQERYFVVSRQDWIVNGTKDTGYATCRAAKNARQRVDEKDRRNGRDFVPMKIVYGTAE